LMEFDPETKRTGPVTTKIIAAFLIMFERRNLFPKAIDDSISLFENLKTYLREILSVDSEEYDEMMKTMVEEMKEYNSYA
ncbi:3139_t:CDS:2, partial [Acaulospora morrowiae]